MGQRHRATIFGSKNSAIFRSSPISLMLYLLDHDIYIIIISLPYYSDGIHVESIMHMYDNLRNLHTTFDNYTYHDICVPSIDLLYH